MYRKCTASADMQNKRLIMLTHSYESVLRAKNTGRIFSGFEYTYFIGCLFELTLPQFLDVRNEVLYHIEKLHSAHLKIEAELIRYSINADTSFIPFFKKNIDDATEHFMTLTDFTKDNPSHRLRLDSIRTLGRKKVDFVNNVIQARLHSLDSVRKLIPSPYNTSLVTGVNQVVEEMQRAEKELLHQRMAAHEVEVKKFTFTFTTLLIATGSIIIVLFLTINTTLR